MLHPIGLRRVLCDTRKCEYESESGQPQPIIACRCLSLHTHQSPSSPASLTNRTNRPAAVTNITGQHRHVSSSSSTDSYDDDDDDGDGDGDGDGYYYDDDDSQSDGELERHFQEQLFGRNVGGNVGGSVLSLPSGTTSASRSGAGSRRGSVDNAWASTSKKSVAGRRRRRHNVESGGRNVDGSSGGVGGHLHLRNMSSSTAEEDAAGEHIFDGSTISLLTVGLFCYIFNDIASHCRVISCYIYSSYMCMSVRGGERARKF